ncbi:MAG: iron-dependent repressor [Flavobacteriales bacterium]|nr:iron-dependent repressor [Flavobacteriales bacterium]|tara:strand:+ start:1257 stop:1913 length:657 start_codon:yes stop_codon:yes gene_type:complete
MITSAEENYLKAILSISLKEDSKVSTNSISREIGTSAASVSDMLKKLQDKKLIKYEKYKGVELSKKGEIKAINILRKHRLWETFLVNNLGFNWGEVHDVAEQLEHIKSSELIDRLDSYLSFPKYDPHGEPIPNKEGKIPSRNTIPLNELKVGIKGNVMGVTLDDKTFLNYLTQLNISIGTEIELIEKIIFDKSLSIKIEKNNNHITNDVAKHLLIRIK